MSVGACSKRGMARTATAAAVAGLAAAAAAWFGQGSLGGARQLAAIGGSAPEAVTLVQWQSQATDSLGVGDAVLHNASSVEIAVIDTGADVAAPTLAAKHPLTYNAVTGKSDVKDAFGHGTLVASIAAGAADASGVAGAGGDARLLIVKAADGSGLISVRAEATAIRYAVTHGAKILNLSFAGPTTSPAERAAVAFAVKRGVLVIAAAGNAFASGNPVEYPAALLQPVGSSGRGGAGLVVGASDAGGQRASFSASGSWISLAAPGVGIAGALSSTAPLTDFPRLASATGLFGYGSGTSFAAPQVAGAAALVWGANPSLTARQVADILERTASGHGSWAPDLGYGVIDVAAAVGLAGQAP
jgi:subtilisin family serine protease